MGIGHNNTLKDIREIHYPNSLGFLWTKMSRFLGFGEYGQWKVMGLAAYGNSQTYYENFFEFIKFDEKGDFSINGDILQHRVNGFSEFEKLFGSKRLEIDEITDRHKDIAAALQKVTKQNLI